MGPSSAQPQGTTRGETLTLATLAAWVRKEADLPSDEAARRVVEATLAAAGRLLSDAERTSLAAALPGDLGRALGRGRVSRIPREAFFGEVARLEDVCHTSTVTHADVVCDALHRLIGDDRWRELGDRLPAG